MCIVCNELYAGIMLSNAYAFFVKKKKKERKKKRKNVEGKGHQLLIGNMSKSLHLGNKHVDRQ